jgi:hypothetical protein
MHLRGTSRKRMQRKVNRKKGEEKEFKIRDYIETFMVA